MKRKIFILLIVTISLVSFGLSFSGIKSKAYEKNSDLFINSKDITVTDNASVPKILKDKDGNDVSTMFDNGKNGVLLSSSKEGAKVDFAQEISGSFETEFRVYSDVVYHDQTGADWNSGSISINKYCDLQEFAITFIDEKGQTFEIIISGGEAWNNITASARVKVGAAEFGYHYLNDAVKPNDTALKNTSGYFTRIGGTTFSNVTRRGNKLTDDSVPVTIGFNAETMEIYCYHYGITKYYDESQKQYRVIADLDSKDFGLNKIESFDNYKVSFSFNSITENKTAKAIIYSINGQSLSGDILIDSIGPNTMAKFKTNSISGKKYVIPAPITFDLLDSSEDFKTILNIKNAEGENIDLYSANGQVIKSNEYSEGCYITPNVEGEITISYTSFDSYGMVGKTSTYSIYNYSNEPTSKFDFDELEQNYLLENRSIGDKFNIYPCEVTSDLYLNDKVQYANVSLYKDNILVEGFDSKVISSVETIELEEGEYKLVYFIDGFYVENHSYTFSVSNSMPSVTLSHELEDKYIFGKIFDIPTANYKLNGTSKKATAVLYDPDGKQVDTSGEVKLEKVGLYKLTYMVRFDEIYTFDYYFTSVHSTNGLFTEEKGITTEYGNTGNMFNNTINGILVTSSKNDLKVTYNKVLDLSKNTKEDSLIELITVPSEIGVLDAWQYTIKLTDIYDEKNYVSIIVFKGSWGNQWSYVRVGSSEQVPSGLENGKVLTQYNAGTPVNYSMTGEPILGNEVLQLYYDNNEKSIYVDNIKRAGYAYGNLVIDMDSSEYFSEKTLWNGFTTGEVYMSITLQNLQDEKAQLLIKSINGVSFENEWIKDNNVPVLTVDTLDYDVANLPVGLVNHEYRLFNAKAYDALDGIIDYTVSVYKDYQTVNQLLVSNDKDLFTPVEEGQYSLVYKAVDSSNNIVTEVINVNVVSEIEELNYRFDSTLISQISVGEYLTIPTGQSSGGSGKVNVELVVTDPANSNVNVVNNRVFIEKVGIHKVCIKLVDYIGVEKNIEYLISASINENPILQEFNINNTMVEGYEYNLNNFNALDYFTNSGSPIEAIKKIEIVQAGNVVELDSSFIYKPKANINNEEVIIRFIAKANSGNGESVLEKKVNLIKLTDENNNYNLANLFFRKDITNVSVQDKYIEYSTNIEGATLEYVNYLVADGFSMNFTVNKDKNNFSAIEVLIQDSQNLEQTIKMTISKTGTITSNIVINNIKNLTITSDFYQTTSYGFKFYYNAKSNAIVDGNTNKTIAVIKQNLDGSNFDGFTSGKVKVFVKYLGVEGESSIRFSSVSNQSLTNDTKDRVAPAVQIMGELNVVGEINEKFTVYRAVASDGVDPNPSITVRIMKDGKTIYSGDISKNYDFIPNEYGEYTILYTALDSNNRKTTITYILTIKDRIKPELTLDSEIISTAKVGKTYTLPTPTVSDNNDTELQIYLFILAPDGELVANPLNDYSFAPTLKGEYKVTYYVQDSYNCYSYLEYLIQVK